MTRRALWTRYVVPIVAGALAVYALCVAAFFAYHKAHDTRSPNPIRVYAARLVDQLALGSSAESEALQRDILFLLKPVWLVDKTGAPVSPFPDALPVAWEALPHPRKPFEPLEWTNPRDRTTLVLVRLERHPDWYFVSRWGPPLWLPHSTLLGPIIWFALLSLVVALLLMAREIESLVRKLSRSEKARTELIEDLGHDLRTPLTSTTSLVESLSDYGESMSPGERAESLALVRQELAYVHRLLGDLFLLAGMSEAAYRKKSEPVDFPALVRAETDGQRALSLQAGRSLRVSVSLPDELPPKVNGDAGLLQRLVRNALENARRFARDEITLTLRREGSEFLALSVRDDGPGLSEGALGSFGKRRATRIASGAEKRLSLGLGSVIMRTIAEIHGGSLSAVNLSDGAEIVIRLPLMAAEASTGGTR